MLVFDGTIRGLVPQMQHASCPAAVLKPDSSHPESRGQIVIFMAPADQFSIESVNAKEI
jgi:hypothetical protein